MNDTSGHRTFPSPQGSLMLPFQTRPTSIQPLTVLKRCSESFLHPFCRVTDAVHLPSPENVLTAPSRLRDSFTGPRSLD